MDVEVLSLLKGSKPYRALIPLAHTPVFHQCPCHVALVFAREPHRPAHVHLPRTTEVQASCLHYNMNDFHLRIRALNAILCCPAVVHTAFVVRPSFIFLIRRWLLATTLVGSTVNIDASVVPFRTDPGLTLLNVPTAGLCQQCQLGQCNNVVKRLRCGRLLPHALFTDGATDLPF